MSKPIKIEYLAEVAAYLRDVKKVELSTDDVAEALVATSNSGDDLERKLSRAMRDAAKDVETLERAIDQLPEATDDAARKMDREFEGMGDSAKDAGRDMGDSFKGSLGESLSSGGADLSETISETLGEAVAEAPLPVAALAGLAILAWNVLKAESEKQKQELADLFDITDLTTGAIEHAALLEEALIDLGGTKEEGLDRVKQLSKELAIPIGDVTAMLTGETNPAVNKMLDALKAQNEELTKNWLETGHISDANRALLDAGEAIIHQHDDQAEGLRINAERTKTWQQGLEGVEDTAQGVLLTEQQIAALKASQVESTKHLAYQTGIVREHLEKMPKDINVKINTQLAGSAGSQTLGSIMGSAYSSSARAG